MNKVKCGNFPIVYPIPAIIAGAMVDGKVNYVTLGNCGIMSVDPPVIYISTHKNHYTNKGIKESGHYSVNIPSKDQVVETDYCGIKSGHKTDKSSVFKSFFGVNKLAPMIEACPVNILCKVIHTYEVYDMEVFVGQVEEVYVSETCTTKGKPDTKKIDPLLYMADNQYWSIGDVVGTGFKDGHKYKVK